MVIYMRTYYLFKINKILNPVYETKTNNIYKMLSKINSLDKKEFVLAKKLYTKIVIPIDKHRIDNHLLMSHINDMYYTKNNNVHTLYSDLEESRVIIYNTYIKIITTKNISSFFKDMYTINKDFFVVDFNNKDYFYLSSLFQKSLV